MDIALIDGTFFSLDELPGRDVAEIGHPLIRDSIEELEGLSDIGKKKVHFIHFNHSNPVLSAKGEARKFIAEAGFNLAEQGMVLEI
ncbi:hypothetical protein GF360_01350 [candidate division WWE3 bacterium]|nr:hypothetical protein [candidate division WWE3 bacterium]